MVLIALIVVTTLHAQTPTQSPTPSPTPSPTASPPLKHLDVEWRKDLASADDNNAATWLVAGDAHVFVSGSGNAVTAYTADGHDAWTWTDRCIVPPVVAGTHL